MSLQNNTTALQALLEQANALPDAGSGGITPSGTKEITENGTYDVTNYATAEVNVPSEEPVTEELAVTENGEYTPADGVDGFSKVTVNVPSEEPVLQSKTVTPTTAKQTVTPDGGYDGLSDVTVEKIPDRYKDVSGVTAGAPQVLDGYRIVDATGKVVEGAMPNNGAISEAFDGLTVKEYTVPAGYTSGGTVKLDDTIDNIVTEQTTQIDTNAALIQQIKAALDGKAAGGGSGIDTCTVKLNYPTRITQACYTSFVDGEVTAQAASFPNTNNVTLENVVCGSFFLIRSDTIYLPVPTFTGGGNFIELGNVSMQGYAATNVAGGTMKVDMIDDD